LFNILYILLQSNFFWCNIFIIRHSKWPLELLTDVVFLTTPVLTEPVSLRPLVCSISILNGKAIQLH
jgi:hypothetical protein